MPATTHAAPREACGRVDCTNQTKIASNLETTNVTVTAPGTGAGTRYVSVGVSYVYQPLVFNLGHMTGSSALSLNFTFTPSIRMRYMP